MLFRPVLKKQTINSQCFVSKGLEAEESVGLTQDLGRWPASSTTSPNMTESSLPSSLLRIPYENIIGDMKDMLQCCPHVVTQG
jgi:hypothetical protein